MPKILYLDCHLPFQPLEMCLCKRIQEANAIIRQKLQYRIEDIGNVT